MRVRSVVTVAPAVDAVVTLDQAKQHLGVVGDASDDMVQMWLNVAVDNIDGPLGWTRRALGVQTIEMHADHFPGRGHLGWEGDLYRWRAARLFRHAEQFPPLCPPVVTINSVTYYDPTGVLQTLDPSVYLLDERVLFPAPHRRWPCAQSRPGAVVVNYTAGYATGMPWQAKPAALLALSNLWSLAQRDPSLRSETVPDVGSRSFDVSPTMGQGMTAAVEALLTKIRVVT